LSETPYGTGAEWPSTPGSMVACNACLAQEDAHRLAAAAMVCAACGNHIRVGARTRLEWTADPGSFVEWDGDLLAEDPLRFVDKVSYPTRLAEARKKTGELDAIVTGRGSILGLDVALGLFEFGFMGGSMGSVVGEKLFRLFAHAEREHLPVLVVTASGGARMQEGTLSLMQMAKVTVAVEHFRRERLPYVTLLADPTTGGVAASLAMQGDIILAEPKAQIGFAGPRVIEHTIGMALPPDFQDAERLLERGLIDAIVPRAEQKALLHALLWALTASRTTGRKRARVGRTRRRPAEQSPRATGTVWEIVKQSRRRGRPGTAVALRLAFDRFIELRGDRAYRDDPAIRAGIAWLDEQPVVVVGQERGETAAEQERCNFGMAFPEGYRKAVRVMELAERFRLPVVTIVDTPGAYPGPGAEQRGQAGAIASALGRMAGLEVPTVSVVLGQGGSGGAMALALADRVLMFENATYSVISPEGCASILWHSSERAPQAAEALKLTAGDLLRFGIVDEILPEPPPGGEVELGFARTLRAAVARHLRELRALGGDPIERRAARYERMGTFRELPHASGARSERPMAKGTLVTGGLK
jgi:acetyl-CoA carboxylase carboxyl transferase beta subunit/acetyl-CoA carboxylase carboxyl transferase alpha subunit